MAENWTWLAQCRGLCHRKFSDVNESKLAEYVLGHCVTGMSIWWAENHWRVMDAFCYRTDAHKYMVLIYSLVSLSSINISILAKVLLN